MRYVKAGKTLIELGYAGEHNSTEITFDLPCNWEGATSETVYLVFVAPGEKIGLPYDVVIDSEKKKAYWTVPECATKAGSGQCQLTLLREPWEITDENCEMPEIISKSPWYNTICLKGVNEMSCGCDNHCGSSWLEKIIHFIKLYEHNDLYVEDDGIHIYIDSEGRHRIKNTGGGGGGEPAEYLKKIVKDTDNLVIKVYDKNNNLIDFPYGGEPASYIKSIAKSVENAQKVYIVIKDKDNTEMKFGFEAGDNVAFIVNDDGTIKINASGGGSEPEAYIKSAVKDETTKTITLTDKNDNTLVFPYSDVSQEDIEELQNAVNALEEALEDKVDKETGKGLSTNDYTAEDKAKVDSAVQDANYTHTDNNYTNEDKTKLANIEANAQVNVQSDWNETDASADSYIKNKPTLASKISDLENDSNFVEDANYVHTDNNFENSYKEQIETNTDNITDLQNDKQDKTDNTLPTTDKTIVGAIAEVLGLVASALNFRGAVDNIEDLPATSDQGDIYDVINEGHWYGYNGSEWIRLGEQVNLAPYRTAELQDAIDNAKVDKEAGKGLSTNDFTDIYKNRVDTNANKITNLENGKVDKIVGKGLSTNDFDNEYKAKVDNAVEDANYVHTDNNYTTEDKNKLSGIEAGAEKNVQADWNETDTSADSYVKNKPTVPTKTSDLTNDSNFVVDANYNHTDNNYTNAEKTKVANAVSDANYVHTDNNFTGAYKGKIDQFDTELGKKVDKVNTPLRLYGVDGSGNQTVYQLGDGLEFDGNTIKAVGSDSFVPPVGFTFMLDIPVDPHDLFGEGSYEQAVNKFLRAGTNTAVGGADQWVMSENQLAQHGHSITESGDPSYLLHWNFVVSSSALGSQIAGIDSHGYSPTASPKGQSAPIDNKPAYINRYVWTRTA